jgi:molecular chaperone GrpE (heat shock protein)
LEPQFLRFAGACALRIILHKLLEMRGQTEIRISKWAFFLGDLLLVGTAALIYYRSSLPLGLGQVGLIVLCVAMGAALAILPFLLEYRVLARLAESEALADVVGQIKNIEGLAAQIASATARWQSVQEVADKVAGISRAIAERMSSETKAFTEFMQRANDSEKATLRLEADKLRRAEGDWVHVLVRMLDHVYALHMGALRSGQPNLISQLDQFQHACRDAARRIGLAPFAANPSDPFDAERHQLLDGEQAAAAGATVAETIATGYTFQGRLLRPALVRLHQGNGHGQANDERNEPDSAQSHLRLGEPKQT